LILLTFPRSSGTLTFRSRNFFVDEPITMDKVQSIMADAPSHIKGHSSGQHRTAFALPPEAAQELLEMSRAHPEKEKGDVCIGTFQKNGKEVVAWSKKDGLQSCYIDAAKTKANKSGYLSMKVLIDFIEKHSRPVAKKDEGPVSHVTFGEEESTSLLNDKAPLGGTSYVRKGESQGKDGTAIGYTIPGQLMLSNAFMGRIARGSQSSHPPHRRPIPLILFSGVARDYNSTNLEAAICLSDSGHFLFFQIQDPDLIIKRLRCSSDLYQAAWETRCSELFDRASRPRLGKKPPAGVIEVRNSDTRGGSPIWPRAGLSIWVKDVCFPDTPERDAQEILKTES